MIRKYLNNRSCYVLHVFFKHVSPLQICRDKNRTYLQAIPQISKISSLSEINAKLIKRRTNMSEKFRLNTTPPPPTHTHSPTKNKNYNIDIRSTTLYMVRNCLIWCSDLQIEYSFILANHRGFIIFPEL